MNYNLLEEKWIPVLWADGKFNHVGIKEALTQAGRIRQIAASNPMDRIAILRFLLAVLYWCKRNPPEGGDMKPGDSFPAEWFTKLDKNRDCFNIFGEGKRFYQNDAYKGKKAEHTTHYLIHEVPSGTNKWHFRHSTDMKSGLCPACCAMGLLRLPVFSTSGGRGMSTATGKSPGINMKPPLYFIPLGNSLAETIRFSWQYVPDLGTPEWEIPNRPLPKKDAVPVLAGMTWLPRSVWLADPEEPEAACISCGRMERLIRLCVFDGKGSSKTEGRIWNDPHIIYEQKQKGDSTAVQTSDALGASDAAAGQWSKIAEAIFRGQRANGRSNVWVVGFSTVQNDKYLEATEWLISCLFSPTQIAESIDNIKQWQKQGASLTPRLIRAVRSPDEKMGSLKHKEIPPIIAGIRPHVEGRVSEKAGELLAGDDEAWQQAAEEYRPMMEVIAGALSPGFTTAAVWQRRQITEVLPDMRPKIVTQKKTTKERRKK